jgi:hypothetical protein
VADDFEPPDVETFNGISGWSPEDDATFRRLPRLGTAVTVNVETAPPAGFCPAHGVKAEHARAKSSMVDWWAHAVEAAR